MTKQKLCLSSPFLVGASRLKRSEVAVRVSLAEYRQAVVAFAREARYAYFADGARRTSDFLDGDAAFWAEFDERLTRAEAAITAG